MHPPKFWSRFPSVDLRLTTSVLGLVAQGVAWACGYHSGVLSSLQDAFPVSRSSRKGARERQRCSVSLWFTPAPV